MANTVGRWDWVPVYGVWLHADDTPVAGVIDLALSGRVTRVDGRVIYPDGAVVQKTIGDTAAQDTAIRSAVRAAWRDADETSQGEDFDGVAWDSWWDDVVVPAAIFTRFPAADDPDIVQHDYQVTVSEALTSGNGKSYPIQPLMAHMDLPVPGINLGLVEVPPESPSVPAPVYAKGIAGGVASLDGEGKVPLDQLPEDLGGGVDEGAVVSIIEANPQAPPASSVTDSKVATNAGITLSKTADTTAGGGRLAMTNAERAKLLATPSDAQSAAMVDSRADARITAFVGAAPSALNTLDELAAALGDDANFAATVTTALAGKASDTAAAHKAGTETFTGAKTFTVAPVVPAESFPQSALVGNELVWVIYYNSDTDSWPAEGSAAAPDTEDMPDGMRRKCISIGDVGAPMPTELLRAGITHDGHPVLDSWLPHRDSAIWGELA